jgi:hypothetical protein
MDSVFTNNTAGFGGGLHTSADPALVAGSMFTDNSVTDAGAGIYLANYDVQLVGSTLAGNTTSSLGPACHTRGTTELDSLGNNQIDYLDDCAINLDPTDLVPEPAAFLVQIAALCTLAGLARQRGWTRRRSRSLHRT